jgi:hypothetical protein
MDIQYHEEYQWQSEEFTFIIPDGRPLQDCILEISMWDRGAKDESGTDYFCGMMR